MANACLQLVAIGLIGTIILTGMLPPIRSGLRVMLLLLAAFAAVMLLQLVPLPYPVWSALPGRAPIVDAFALAGAGMPWLPVSLTPDATIATMLSLLPATAIVLATTIAPPAGRRDTIVVLVGFALVSVLLGCLQRAGGIASPLYAYANTNRGSAVGLFANRNHLGTLTLCTLPFVAALARHYSSTAHRLVASVVGLVIAGGPLLTGSRAAIGLLVPTLVGCAALLLHGTRISVATRWLSLGVAASLVAAVALASMSHDRGEDPARSQHRGAILSLTLLAVRDHLPLGSGGGSFTTVYPRYEYPAAVTPEYTNHAHDDYAETLLEFGIPGALVIIAVVAAWLRRTWAVWAIPGKNNDHARAGAVAIGAILAHSLVDYPLRTAAIGAVAGLAAALLATPGAGTSDLDRYGAPA